MLAKFYHLKLLHGGVQQTLSAMREKYWPVNGKRIIRTVRRNCFRCSRAEPTLSTQQTGQLPTTRVTPSRAFTITGMDYAGPIYLRPPNKKATAIKAYICIFICFSTKAVHIELVGDLTTAAFIAALRRFVARRGLPLHLHSDNGKNFQGARHELTELYRLLSEEESLNTITATLANEGINWHMTPPKAPHFGGLWEAAVKVAKQHLHRQLGNSHLSYESMATVLTQIEASMNSRPLIALSEDPDDLNALTPAHFLVGTSLQALPDPDLSHLPLNRLDLYQRMQSLHQQFWHRWRMDYLHELQREHHKEKVNRDLKPGRLVVIAEELQPPLKWPLARIVAVHPGKDGLVRVVSVRTSRGVIKRPAAKIALLPMETIIDASTTETNVPIINNEHPPYDIVRHNTSMLQEDEQKLV